MATGIDPRCPVLVGAGQLSRRVDRGEEPMEPVDLMAEALRRAAADAGAPGALTVADSVQAVRQLSFRYHDPGALVAERIGASPRETVYTVTGGNWVQALLNRAALDIQAGRSDLVLLCGAEAWRTRQAYKARGERPPWTSQPESERPTLVLGEDDPPMSHPAELARGIGAPVQVYPIMESALRAAAGRRLDDHRDRIATLWSAFSEVAATNPHAWIAERYSAAQIATATPDNRMVGYPYTKRLCSNNAVEQGAGLIVCSVERAEQLGVARDRWVFLHSGADANAHWFLSHRADLHSSPAMGIAGRAALDLAGVGPDDLAHVDLYSCFPSAVQLAAAELGLGLDRPLTVTGGMSFAGGPWNNYVMHAVATMLGVLRADPGAIGLCSANGGFTTEHSFGVYSTDPPGAGRFRHAHPQAEVDALPRRDLAESHDGPVTVEGYTVMFARDGTPEHAPMAVLLPDGRRAWGVCADAAALAAMTEVEHVGRTVELRADGTVAC